jgi:sacsin
MKLRLRALDRHTDPHLVHDSHTVLSPLTAPSSIIRRFDVHDWSAVSQEGVFLSRTAFNADPECRQHIMVLVAAEHPLLCLFQIISSDHVGICWSQTAFPIHQPTREVLGKVPGNGQPKIDMVWRHLGQIKDAAQHLKRHHIRDFLTDLSVTYEYLQDHVLENTGSIDLKNSAVWLNLNESDHNAVLLDDIRSSWHTIDELVLSNSFDAGPIKAVRPGLMRYEKLLRALGCSSIIYLTVTRPELHSDQTVSESLQRLRHGEEMTDIKFSTEGRTIHAHRLISTLANSVVVGRWTV